MGPAETNGPTARSGDSHGRELANYEDVVKLRTGGFRDVFLFTDSGPLGPGEGIGCVGAADGRLIWHQPPLVRARYTTISVGDAALVELSGWPQENYLARRRVSDGRVVGRSWKVGRVLGFAIAGDRVAVLDDKEKVRIYDDRGRVLRTVATPGATKLVGFPRGFAVVSPVRTMILSSGGRLIASVR